MSGHGIFWTLVRCSDQLLASIFYNNFNLRIKITKKYCNPLEDSYLLLTHETFGHHLIRFQCLCRISQVISYECLHFKINFNSVNPKNTRHHPCRHYMILVNGVSGPGQLNYVCLDGWDETTTWTLVPWRQQGSK